MTQALEPEWRARRRRKILEAAAQAFAEQPYHQFTMDGVAERAGIGKGTLYRYYPSKENLYLAIFDEALTELAERLETEIRLDLPPLQALPRMIAALVPTFIGHFPGLRALGEDHAVVAERKRRLFHQRRRHITGLFATVLRQGMADGSVRPDVDAELSSAMLMGMCWSAVNAVPPEDAARLGAGIADLFLHGTLAVPPREGKP